uniref:Uncharacterized protein n=1 Tax=Zea mays TaxID=4577 RepID=C0PLM4_MAIZE|nr:unknown [Zea mays]
MLPFVKSYRLCCTTRCRSVTMNEQSIMGNKVPAACTYSKEQKKKKTVLLLSTCSMFCSSI